METKSFELSIKQVSEGKVVATLAKIGVIDRDGDVLKDGLLKGGQIVAIKPQHKWDHVNLGVAKVYEKAGTMEAAMEFNLAIPSAKDWFESIRFSHEKNHRQQYSFGFHPIEFEHGTHDGKSVRFLKHIDMAEVSPVLIGASIGSTTLSVKEDESTTPTVQESPSIVAEHPIEVVASEPQDIKRYTLEQLVEMVDYHVRDLTLVGTMRQKDGKKLADATLARIDCVSKHWDELRALVHLGPVERDALDDEWAARHRAVNEQISREHEAAAAKEDAKNDALYQQFLERSARLDQLLYSQSS